MFKKICSCTLIISMFISGLSACSVNNGPQSRNAVEVTNAMMAIQMP